MSVEIPKEVFHALATMAAKLGADLKQECDLKPIEFLTLWYIRHFGKLDPEDLSVVTNAELARMLQHDFGHQKSSVSKLLKKLEDRGVIERKTLNTTRLATIFGPLRKNRRQVVLLNKTGEALIDLFKRHIEKLAKDKIEDLPFFKRQLLERIIPQAASIAKSIVATYEPKRASRLYGHDVSDGFVDLGDSI